MIAQLSPSEPRGSPSASSIGVRCAGYLPRYSGSLVLPQTSASSKSRPAARTKMRAVRLLTLGFRMFRVFAATCSSDRLDQLRLVLAALEAPPRHELDAGLDDEHVTQSLTDRVRERRPLRPAARRARRDRQRRLLLHARRLRPDEHVAADPRRELADDLADRRREDVDAADDQHVVGSADAADARAGAAARARRRSGRRRGRACGSAGAAPRGGAGA